MIAATMPPLHLPDFPTVGPTGERDNIERLCVVMSATLPAGRVLVLDVAHDDACEAGADTSRCTCTTVDVTLHLHDPRTS